MMINSQTLSDSAQTSEMSENGADEEFPHFRQWSGGWRIDNVSVSFPRIARCCCFCRGRRGEQGINENCPDSANCSCTTSSCLLQVSLMINKIIGGKSSLASGPKISSTTVMRLQRERFLSVEKLISSDLTGQPGVDNKPSENLEILHVFIARHTLNRRQVPSRVTGPARQR